MTTIGRKKLSPQQQEVYDYLIGNASIPFIEQVLDESKQVEAVVSGQIAEVTEPEKLVLKHIKLPLTIDQMSRYMFDANMNMIAETRGWGWIQYKEDAELLQDTLGEMIVKAFNKVYGS